MPFQYTFRSDDIPTWDVDTRDLLENRDRELELYSTTIDTSFLNLNASNLTSGTVPSARMTGAYTVITGLGTLTSLTIDGPSSPSVFFGDWNQNNNWSGIKGTFGYLLTGSSDGLDTGVYLRSESTSHPIRIGSNNTNTLTVTNTSATVAGTMFATTFSGSGASLTSLPANQLTGTISSARLNGTYTGIQLVGTLQTLTIGATFSNSYITINAPTGYYAIQYFQINSVYKWHYEVNPAGDRWSLVQTGAEERIGVNSAKLAFNGAGSPSIQMGDWSADTSYSAIETSRGYLLLGRASADDGIYLRSSGASPVHIGQGGNNTMIVGATDVTIAGSLKLSASTEAYVSYANTPDTAMPWMQGPTFQGRTGWAFYQQVTGSYRMGFRSGSSGATRYMWCADNTLLGSVPNDSLVTTTLNVIGNMRTTAGYYGTVTYGSYGSLSMYGSNNGYVGITFPEQQTTWMSALNGQIFGCYRNDNTWNFYVSNGTFTPSDERYKRDIEPLQHGMNLIREIVPVTYDPLTEDPADDPEQTVGRTHYGFTTQNILQALTNAGETRDVAIVDIGGPANESNESDRQYLNNSALIAPIVKAIQELDQRLQQLETV